MSADRGRVLLIMLAAVVALALGETALAKGMKQTGRAEMGWVDLAVAILRNGWVLAGSALLVLHLGLYLLSLRRADAIVTFSQASKDRIVEIFATDPRRIHVTHHGLRFSNATRVGDRDERQRVLGLTDGEYVLSVSAFYPYKNLPRLIEAFARLKPAIKHRLVLIGAPTRFLTVEKIMAIARACGVEKDVLCLGLVPGEELPKFYRNAAVLVMPSLEETFGHPVLEAMAFACPVVTSNRSSMAEIVGEAGILVNPYSVESIADGLDRVLSDTARQQQMAEAGMARARRFTREAFLGRLLRVLVGHD